MPGRRRIDTAAPLRSSIANAAFAVEERVVWGGADVLRRIVDAIKWPFERAIWAIERGFVWPLEERTGGWGAPVRTFGVVVLALLAVGAGVLGLLWASGSGSGGASHVQEAAAPVAAPVVQPPAKEQLKAVAPVLQGTKPDFSAESGGGVAKSAGEVASSESSAAAGVTASAESAAGNSTAEVASSGADKVEPAGPAATLVAQQFASAFVLYETGHLDAKVRLTFKSTATPQLVRELLRRPPRLPADATVPQAKVLNVVAGPHHGDTYTVSVSLLRVGVTSELRLDLQRDPKSGRWTVADALG
jgi:hypothetical protein